VAAIRVILETMEEMRTEEPSHEEVDRIVSQIVNGFVFNFQDPSQIVSREMYYLAQGLEADWLERYLQGIQRVTPRDVLRVFEANVNPKKMIILILGNPEDFDLPPETLGPVQIWNVETGSVTSPPSSGSPHEGPRSPR
jgi:zinc protease